MFQIWFNNTHLDFDDEDEAMKRYATLIKMYPNKHIFISELIEYELIQVLKEINPLKSYPNPYRTNRVLFGVPRI